jgi:hypothetical protein
MYQVESSLKSIVPFVASDLKIPKTYVVCTEDKAIDVNGQRAMAGAAEAQTVEWHCGHSPFLKEKETQEIVGLINGIAMN